MNSSTPVTSAVSSSSHAASGSSSPVAFSSSSPGALRSSPVAGASSEAPSSSAARLRISTIPPLTLCEVQDLGMRSHESSSPFCVKVHRALKARGLTYERRHASNPNDYRSLNPSGQVPILLVGDEPVFDSTKILARLEQLCPDPLGPNGVAGEARAIDRRMLAESLLWEELADSGVNAFLVASRWADERNWPLVREAYFAGIPSLLRPLVTAKIRSRVVGSLAGRDVMRHGHEACWSRFSALLDQLEARAPLTGYWLGDLRTAADFALFGQLHSFRTPLTAWQSGEVAARPILSAYLDRLDAETRGVAQVSQAA